MTGRLRQFNLRLGEVFSDKDHFVSHERAAPILSEMAADPGVLHEIVTQSWLAPDFSARKRINPVLALDICHDQNYSLIAHLWIPLDDSRVDLTHQSVHHHGKLLLTSMSAWGQGYESVLFKTGFRVNPSTGATQMEIDKIYKNPRGHLEFVGPDTPHVVFFPSKLTVTYALWSKTHRQATSVLRRIPGVQTYKKGIKAGLQSLGLASTLGLNVVEKLDFYPHAGTLLQMKDRVKYAVGSEENFMQNFFWCLQELKFERFDALAERIERWGGHPRLTELLQKLEKGEPIARRMESLHLGVERAQFGKRELLSCFSDDAAAGGKWPADQVG